ncbi:tonB-system energizer ExbB [Paracoccus onubensis]|uniref:Biopolymer transport protein ExbB n=1 Tax=Paracoccus onubensis TaxID=1675788 RepID=A0A418T827_9RHOB|nr:tonB-system energizer ExbB [Paracoccus onubensis]RJE89256.1 tonB-system energizer ExbB [Paracoccus onubensis]
MNHKPLPRLSAGIVATLACLIAAPGLAQDTTPAAPQTETQAQTTPEAETPEAAAPAGETTGTQADDAGAGSTGAEAADEADAGSGETETPAAEAEIPADAATDGDTDTGAETPATEAPAADAPAAETGTETEAPAAGTPAADAPAANASAANAPTTDTPAVEAPATEEPAEAPGFLPQSIHDALAPILNTPERDPNLPHDLSPVGMFLAADWVVKAVMIGLAFASIVTWTVFVVKLLELWRAGANVQSGINRIGRSANLPAALAAAARRRDPVSRMIRAASQEYDQSAPAFDRAGNDGIKERVDSHLERIEAVAGRGMARGTGILATIGSTAPFVGLFGTVWGIMNSFIGISEAQTTNLAVVAPGIAEALLATALGLIAAIPAVVIYNVFARAIAGYRLRLANAAAGVRRLVSRDLDFRGITPAAAPATEA